MKKKVATPAAVPASVAVPKPKVAPKKGAVKLAIPDALQKAVPSIPASASRTQRRKVAAAIPAAPEQKFIPVKKTTTASLTGTVSALQQARAVLLNSRGLGEAVDSLNRLETQAREQLISAIGDELKRGRVKSDGFAISTESKPDGVHIVLTKHG